MMDNPAVETLPNSQRWSLFSSVKTTGRAIRTETTSISGKTFRPTAVATSLPELSTSQFPKSGMLLFAMVRTHSAAVNPVLLGSTHESVMAMRIRFAAKAEDWKNPQMNVHDIPVDTDRVLVLLSSPDGMYALREPVAVRVSDADRDGIYVVTDEFSSTYGAGDTPSKAIQDYSESLFYEFEDLQENEDALGVALQRELASLRRYIDRR